MPTPNIYFNTIAGTNGLEAENLRLAAMISNEVQAMLADRASILRTDALRFVGDLQGSGSDAIRLRYAGIGAKVPFSATTDESTDVAATLPAYSTAVCTIARNSLRYDISDLASLTGLGNDLDPFRLANSMADSATQRLMEIVCSTFESATTTAGTSGAAFTVDDFFDAMFSLELADNNGPFWCVLHPRQWGHLVDSLRSESNNALAFSPSTADQIAIKGQGYAGSMLGVEMFRSSRVQLDTGVPTDRVGAMFSSGAVAWAVGSPAALPGGGNSEFRPAGTAVVVEFQRSASEALTSVVGHLYAGACLTQSDMIVKIQTSNS